MDAIFLEFSYAGECQRLSLYLHDNLAGNNILMLYVLYLRLIYLFF